MSTKGALASTTTACATLLDSLVDGHGSAQQQEWADVQRACLRILADELGIFAHGRLSAEYRLQENPDVHRMLLQMLQVIENSLRDLAGPGDIQHEVSQHVSNAGDDHHDFETVSAPDDERSDFMEWSYDFAPGSAANDEDQPDDSSASDASNPQSRRDRIQRDLESLLRLARLIRAASRRDHRNRELRALSHDPKDDNGIPLINAFREHIQRKLDGSIGQPEVRTGSPIGQRLLEIMLLRWRRLMYQDYHERNMRASVDQIGRTTEPNVQDSELLEEGRSLKSPAHESTAASVLPANVSLNLPTSVAGSEKTQFHPGHIDFPRRPPRHKQLKDSKCPFCQQRHRFGNERQWQVHAFHDLRPYFCIYNDCESWQSTYATYETWLEHLENDHCPVFWRCPTCCQRYPSSDTCRLHLQTHDLLIDTDNMGAMLQLARRTTVQMTECPFCQEITDNAQSLYAHVSLEHFKHFATLSIPFELIDYEDIGSHATQFSSRSEEEDSSHPDDTELQVRTQPFSASLAQIKSTRDFQEDLHAERLGDWVKQSAEPSSSAKENVITASHDSEPSTVDYGAASEYEDAVDPGDHNTTKSRAEDPSDTGQRDTEATVSYATSSSLSRDTLPQNVSQPRGTASLNHAHIAAPSQSMPARLKEKEISRDHLTEDSPWNWSKTHRDWYRTDSSGHRRFASRTQLAEPGASSQSLGSARPAINSHYTVEQSGQEVFRTRPSGFFEIGRLLATTKNDVPSQGLRTVISGLDLSTDPRREQSPSQYLKRYVVIQSDARDDRGYFYALAISTYSGSGVARDGIVKAHHGIIYSGGHEPQPNRDELARRGEQNMVHVAVRVVMRSPSEKLDVMSRVDYKTIWKLSKTDPVYDLGKVHRDSMPWLVGQFKAVQGQGSESDDDEEEDEAAEEDNDREAPLTKEAELIQEANRAKEAYYRMIRSGRSTNDAIMSIAKALQQRHSAQSWDEALAGARGRLRYPPDAVPGI